MFLCCAEGVDLRHVPVFSIASGLLHVGLLTWLEGVLDCKNLYSSLDFVQVLSFRLLFLTW